MKFKINDREWEIRETDINGLREQYNKDLVEEERDKKSFFYGLCTLSEQLILLNKNVHIERKKKTLYHELMHVYKDVFIGNQEFQFNEEELCDISANSHNIIHKICEDYFKENKDE